VSAASFEVGYLCPFVEAPLLSLSWDCFKAAIRAASDVNCGSSTSAIIPDTKKLLPTRFQEMNVKTAPIQGILRVGDVDMTVSVLPRGYYCRPGLAQAD
jgi:hypothetical protein